MDVSKYEFACQKALHIGLRYARSFGHQTLEVEHVALGLLRSDTFDGDGFEREVLRRIIFQNLNAMPRMFGNFKIQFGKRLNLALDYAEKKAEQNKELVAEDLLWESLQRESTQLKNALKREQDERAKSDEFEPLDPSKKSPKIEVDVKSSATSKINKNPQQTAGDSKQNKGIRIDKKLQKYTTDLSELAERGELDPVVGRDQELRRVLEVLGRKKKNNPLLLGEPGVGKSAIAEALAIRIAEGKVPESMRGMRVLSLDLGSLLAGAKYRGEFEDRLKGVIESLQALKDQVVLFIDEMHMLIGAGNHEGSADAANLLKPALARGEIRCLGATTIDEYRKYVEKDPALERRFQPLMVEEPSRDSTLAILRGIKSKYEVHHGVRILDEALVAAVDLSIRYLTQRRLPDKAIDLLDEAASRLHLQITSIPAELDDLRSAIESSEIESKALESSTKGNKQITRISIKLEKLREDYARFEMIWKVHQSSLDEQKADEQRRQELLALFEKAKADADYDFAAKLQYQEIPKLDEAIVTRQSKLTEMQKTHAFLRQDVGAKEVAEVLSIWARVPVAKLLDEESSKLLTMEERLSRRVFGQSTAVRLVTSAVKRARLGVNDPMRPMGVYLFVGPTGVGKTEMAKALAAELFEDESKMIRVDMSEYAESHSVARLIGAPPGYVGYGEGGELTDAVRTKPYSVILFDEMEKAHPRILDILLQLFDDGRLTDGKGVTVDFRNTLLIATSNLPIHIPAERVPSSAQVIERRLRDSLSQHIRPELVNRFDEIIVFDRLGSRHIEKLCDRYLHELNLRLMDRDLRIVVGPKLRKSLLQSGLDPQYGGRQMRRAFQRLVIDHVSDRLLYMAPSMRGAWVIEHDEMGKIQWAEEFRNNHYLPVGRDKQPA